jgi:hypothetical protein
MCIGQRLIAKTAFTSTRQTSESAGKMGEGQSQPATWLLKNSFVWLGSSAAKAVIQSWRLTARLKSRALAKQIQRTLSADC